MIKETRIARGQYAFEAGPHKFICSKVGDTWELYDQAQGFATVQKKKTVFPSIALDYFQRWIVDNYDGIEKE